MKNILIVITTVASILVSCKEQENSDHTPIVQEADYQEILNQLLDQNQRQASITQIERQIEFWNTKIKEQSQGNLYNEQLGNLYSQLFEKTGDIKNVHLSNEHFENAAKQSISNYKANMLLNMSSNYIKLHQFAKAKEKCEEAYTHSNDPFGVSMMHFDALMELGAYRAAGDIMDLYKGRQNFDYLVRYGKYMDHLGDLDSAIEHTEAALSLLTSLEQKKNIWVRTHLADMYGHEGKIEQSYQAYLSVLQDEPYNLHALKGLAWIAYSHDANYSSAQEILDGVAQLTELPDTDLLLAEISEVSGALERSIFYKREFYNSVLEQNLEHLYNSNLIELMLDDNPQEALALAQKENEQRQTPDTFILLAKAYLSNGQPELAQSMIYDHVLGKTYEPGNIYESGKMLMATGDKAMASSLLQEAAEAAYELGPMITAEIQEVLQIG